jgi:uncharacterized protein (TIGR02646 family)
MIPVVLAAEPATFDATVRQPGLNWLQAKGYAGMAALPPKAKISAYWTRCLPDMMSAYSSVCAYASLRIAPVTGAQSADHFAPKSRAVADAYEWTNYRLACSKMNARKNNFTDVLDPVGLAPDLFVLDVLTGAIETAPHVMGTLKTDADNTVTRLKLDDGEMRRARLSIIDQYFAEDFNTAFLSRESPFIHGELGRQGLLRP